MLALVSIEQPTYMTDTTSSDAAAMSGLPALSAAEARILGCLIEKAAITPDVYPLTVNALVQACNQKSSREEERENMRNMWLCPVRRMWTPGGRCTGCAGRPAPLSFLVRIWSYTLGVTHLVTPWSQKQLREIVGNLSVYFISQGPRIFHPASMFCLTRGLLKIREPRPP